MGVGLLPVLLMLVYVRFMFTQTAGETGPAFAQCRVTIDGAFIEYLEC